LLLLLPAVIAVIAAAVACCNCCWRSHAPDAVPIGQLSCDCLLTFVMRQMLLQPVDSAVTHLPMAEFGVLPPAGRCLAGGVADDGQYGTDNSGNARVTQLTAEYFVLLRSLNNKPVLQMALRLES